MKTTVFSEIKMSAPNETVLLSILVENIPVGVDSQLSQSGWSNNAVILQSMMPLKFSDCIFQFT